MKKLELLKNTEFDVEVQWFENGCPRPGEEDDPNYDPCHHDCYKGSYCDAETSTSL